MKRKIDFEKLVPPGYNYKKEISVYVLWLALAVMKSCGFFIRCEDHIYGLYHFIGESKILIEGVMMPDIDVIMEQDLIGFPLFTVVAIATVIIHYMYHYQESKSIYLMRRLPKRMELHRRCWILPTTALLIVMVIAFLMLIAFYGYYMIMTPEACIAPNQWQKLWRGLL